VAPHDSRVYPVNPDDVVVVIDPVSQRDFPLGDVANEGHEALTVLLKNPNCEGPMLLSIVGRVNAALAVPRGNGMFARARTGVFR